jgi:hypothetical protein
MLGVSTFTNSWVELHFEDRTLSECSKSQVSMAMMPELDNRRFKNTNARKARPTARLK